MSEDPAALVAPPLLHVGLPRCASTLLQTRVFPVLAPTATLPTPDARDEHRASQKTLFLRHAFDEQEVRRLLGVPILLQTGSPWIASNEGWACVFGDTDSARRIAGGRLDLGLLRDGRRATAERLKRLFPGANVLIVVREQVSRLVSHFCSRASLRLPGKPSSLDDLGRRVLLHGGGLDYDEIVRTYQDVFGRERVVVLPFELLVDAPHEFLAEIARLVRRSPVVCSAVQLTRVNDSPANAADLAYAQDFSRMVRRVRRHLGRRFGVLLEHGLKGLLRMRHGRDPVSFSPEVLHALREQAAYHNRALERLVAVDLRRWQYAM